MLGNLDIKQHGLLGGLDQDDHAQYLLIDGTRAMTGTLFSESIVPTNDQVYDLGSSAYRFRRAYLNQILAPAGDPVIDIQPPSKGGILMGSGSGPGLKTFRLNTPYAPASAVFGSIYAAAGATGLIEAFRGGAMAWGHMGIYGSVPGSFKISANGYGCTAHGYMFGTGTGLIDAGGGGGTAQGYCSANGGSTAEIKVKFNGGFATGAARAYGVGANVASIYSNGPGALASGYVSGGSSTTPSFIEARGSGSFASGYIYSGNLSLGGQILAQGVGSFAVGGCFGYGAGYNPRITAGAAGSFAMGYCYAYDQIIASGINSAQFGVGTNALPNSLQVGNAGLRLKGDVGAPGAPQNGDQWVANGYVYIQSNGVAVKIV